MVTHTRGWELSYHSFRMKGREKHISHSQFCFMVVEKKFAHDLSARVLFYSYHDYVLTAVELRSTFCV